MAEHRVLLDAAAFMDTPQAAGLATPKSTAIRTIVQRFLAACYEDIGKAPRLIEGDEMAELLELHLPRRFGVGDPLAAQVEAVLAAYLSFLQETALVPAAFEQRRALDQHASAFRAAVASGLAHREGLAVTGKGKTIVHRAPKTGRNDPCPCGSGKKFKKCCLDLGDNG